MTSRIARPAAVVALCAGLAAAGAGAGGLLLSRYSGTAARPAALAVLPAPAGPIAAAPQPPDAAQVASPVALTIPVIGVHTTLVRLGLTESGALQVPQSTSVAGWYTGSSRPGALGPAVIVGHIDSYRGPGVFYGLARLRDGDLIYIRRADGTLAVFRVTAVRIYRKDKFPSQSVYGPAPDAELRLITCGGAFDPAAGSYLSNVVVFATQVP